MITIRDLHKSFGEREVLHGIKTELRDGIINQIIGKSGSGKTVLLKCVVGLLYPDRGDILYDGRSLIAMTKAQRHLLSQEMGMLFQGSALFDSMTVEENVLFPLQMFSKMTPAEQRRRARYCLDEVGLPDTLHLYPGELSGGMQKRAAIARAIALNPKYLFCDEPNSGLDPLTSIKIDELIVSLTETYRMTTVINTHDMHSVCTIGQHIVFLQEGTQYWEGSKDELGCSGCDRLDTFLTASGVAIEKL